MSGEQPAVDVFRDAGEVATRGAALVVDRARAAASRAGRFAMALSGGSTPRALYTLLGSDALRARVPWPQVHLFFGDERCVPPDHADSNFRMVKEALLDRAPIPAANVHRIRGELEPRAAADAAEQEMRALFGAGVAFPRFDLVLLGLGDDGHTASLFPDTSALGERQRWVVANQVPKLGAWRITLTVPAINAAAEVVFLVTGAGKATMLREVLAGGDTDAERTRLPARLVRPANGALRWCVDRAASG